MLLGVGNTFFAVVFIAVPDAEGRTIIRKTDKANTRTPNDMIDLSRPIFPLVCHSSMASLDGSVRICSLGGIEEEYRREGTVEELRPPPQKKCWMDQVEDRKGLMSFTWHLFFTSDGKQKKTSVLATRGRARLPARVCLSLTCRSTIEKPVSFE
jgi:hypothetical protein